MSVVIQYKCNNEECTFRTTRDMNFPVWKSSVSEEDYHNLSVIEKREKYLAGYINRQYCTVCNTLQPYLQGSEMCLICNTEGLYVKDESICPKCKIGVIKEIDGKSIHFQMKTHRSTSPPTKIAKKLSPLGVKALRQYLIKLGKK